MRFSTFFSQLASLLSVAVLVMGVSIQVRNDAGIVVRRPELDLADTKADFSTDLMAPHDVELVRRVGWTFNNNQHLLMAVVVQNGAVATAACALGNPLTCGIGVIYSVFSFFFAAYLFQDRSEIDAMAPYFVLPPTPEKTLVQRLKAELPAGQWHYVGHVQHKGLNHTVHYYNTGTIQRLRARNVPFWNETQGDLTARASDPDNDGGFVGDYSWLSNNEGPYDSFHSSSGGTSYFASNAGGWMINSEQAIAACADFTDGDGTLDHGLLTIGWNNQEFQWTEPGEEEAVYSECRSRLGD